MSIKYISELEKKVLALVEEAQDKKGNAKKFKAKHYFDGQSDAFGQVLLDLKKLRYELESSVDDPAEDVKEPPKASGRKSKVKKAPESPSPEELYPEQAALLNEAKEAGVITQKSSHFFYEAFTTGKQPGRVQGKIGVFKELANEEIAHKIREQIAQFNQPA